MSALAPFNASFADHWLSRQMHHADQKSKVIRFVIGCIWQNAFEAEAVTLILRVGADGERRYFELVSWIFARYGGVSFVEQR